MFDKINFLNELEVDVFVIKNLHNIFRYTGKKVSYGYVVMTKYKDYFLTDPRYLDLLVGWRGEIVNLIEVGGILKFLKTINFDVLGIESDSWTVYEYNKLKKFFGEEKVKLFFKPFSKYRQIKTKEQIDYIEEAIQVINKVYEKVKSDFLKGKYLGKTELDIRKDIVFNIFQNGGEGESFESIVAFGVGTSIPHRKSGSKILKENQPVLIDMGAIYRGWCSDFTRSFRFGNKVDPLWQKIYDVVRKAHDVAYKMAKPGVKIKDVDLAARKIIEDAGFGKYFTHSLGHGIGIEVHEDPIISLNNEEIIKPGMVFTIEPGIYIPGKFGVRWENIKFVR